MIQNLFRNKNFKTIFFLVFVATLIVVSVFQVNVAYALCVERGTGNPVNSLPDGSCPPDSFDPSLPGALAGGGGGLSGIPAFLLQLRAIMNSVVPFLVSMAVFVVIYGILGYISSASDEEKRKQAKDFIVWGVIGVFLMLSVWGLVSILVNTFNLDNSSGIVTDVYGTQPLPATAPSTLVELIARMMIVGNYIIGLFIAIAVFVVIVGIFNYIREGDNEEKRVEARKFVIWGVISIFLMLSVWGLVNVLIGTFNFDNKAPDVSNIFNNLKL